MLRSRLVLAPVALLLGCGSPRPPAPIAAPAPSPSASAAAPPPPVARWVETGSFNDVGPATADGTPLIVGGRRAVLAADGAMKLPAAPTPEPLEELIEVPSANGKRLVARGERTLYRIDDLLGEAKPLARSAGHYTNIDPGPGVVAAWTSASELPTFVDVESGAPAQIAGLPVAPSRSMAFVDPKTGAAIFAALGLATSTDAGATWHPVTDAAGGALRVTSVAARDGALVAMRGVGGDVQQIDPGAATLGPETPHAPPPADAPPIVRWIARTHRDPLEAAVTSGIATRAGAAIAASKGYVARVDLATGAVAELLDLGKDVQAASCSIARSGDMALVACGATAPGGASTNEIFSVALGQAPLAASSPVVTGTTSTLRSSPSGGAMLVGPCKAGGDGNACVRQPDGRWATIDAPPERDSAASAPTAFGTGPLADGGVAYLAVDHDDDEAPSSPPKMRVVVIEGSGMHRKLPPIAYDDPNGALRVLATLEEGEDHVLRVVVADETGPIVVAQPPSGPASARRVDGVSAARVHGMRGIAVGNRRLLASTDGGGTWAELPTPPHVFVAIESDLGRDGFVLGDNGVRLGGHLRLGWGELDESDVASSVSAPDAPPSAPSAPPPTPQELTCKTLGPATSAPFAATNADADKLFGIKPAPKGTRRITSRWSDPYASAAPTRIVLEVEGPEKSDKPTLWRLRWLDFTEIGAHARVWSGAPPKGVGWGAFVRGGAVSGDRVFVALGTGTDTFIARTTASGAIAIDDLHGDLSPGHATIGARAGDPAAWWRGTSLIAVPAGGTPVTIGALVDDYRAQIVVGAPTKDGVPVFVGTGEWGMLRVYPIPAAKKDAALPAPNDPVPPALLDGWQKVSLRRTSLASLPVCGGKAQGSLFDVGAQSFAFHVDGSNQRAYSGRAMVRATATDACVAGLVASTGAPAAPPSPAAGSPPAKPGGPVTFLRADLAGKRAEGGRAQIAGDTRRLDCSLAPK